jgi:hypothetical protein
MPYSLDVMELALRVLTAITQKHNPNPEDVERLRREVARDKADLPIDELACEVIQHALEQEADLVRPATASGRCD